MQKSKTSVSDIRISDFLLYSVICYLYSGSFGITQSADHGNDFDRAYFKTAATANTLVLYYNMFLTRFTLDCLELTNFYALTATITLL